LSEAKAEPGGVIAFQRGIVLPREAQAPTPTPPRAQAAKDDARKVGVVGLPTGGGMTRHPPHYKGGVFAYVLDLFLWGCSVDNGEASDSPIGSTRKAALTPKR
jgi:hypothetical protein